MARTLNESAIKKRIKSNTALMKLNKKKVSDDMAAMVKGDFKEPSKTRAALSSFIKASQAVTNDTFLILQIKGK